MNRSIAALLVASCLGFGCSGAVGPDPAVSTAVSATGAAVSGVEPSRAPLVTSAHGKVKRVADALAEVSLRSDQRAELQALATDAETRQLKVSAARQELAEAVAGQVAAGAIDRAALASKISAMVEAMNAAEPLDRAAFESVHSILDASQRAEFADAIETQARDAHLSEGWQHLTGQGPGQKLADELKLSDDQRDAFKDVLHAAFVGHHGGGEHESDHEHALMRGGGPDTHGGGFGHGPGKALIEAFRGDTFSFDAVAPPHEMGSRITEMSTRVMDAAEKILPLLTAEQRTLAAQKIREHADHLPFGGPM